MNKNKLSRTFVIFVSTVVIFVMFAASCSKQKQIVLSGAGSTFIMPYFNKAFQQYADSANIKYTYGGIGSGAGIKSIRDKVVDFGASDAFLSDKDLASMPAKVVEFPVASGAVVVAFNIPEIDSLKMNANVLSKIFLGQLTNWNDTSLQHLNPGINLPNRPITVVYRTDGSGTTDIFTNYMSKISSDWKNKVGEGKTVNWPTGIGAKGNPGVAGTIDQTVGSIGYVGSEYAFMQKIPTVILQNKSGHFIRPTIQSVKAAGNCQIPSDTRIMITNSDDPAAYPIVGFTWAFLYQEQKYDNRTKAQADALLKMLDWELSPTSQNIAAELNYAPLPISVINIDRRILRTVTYNGQPILK